MGRRRADGVDTEATAGDHRRRGRQASDDTPETCHRISLCILLRLSLGLFAMIDATPTCGNPAQRAAARPLASIELANLRARPLHNSDGNARVWTLLGRMTPEHPGDRGGRTGLMGKSQSWFRQRDSSRRPAGYKSRFTHIPQLNKTLGSFLRSRVVRRRGRDGETVPEISLQDRDTLPCGQDPGSLVCEWDRRFNPTNCGVM